MPPSNSLLLGATGGGVWVVNTTTLVGVSHLSTIGGVNGMAYDNRTGDLWTVGDPDSLSETQLSDGAVVAMNTSLPSGPVAVAYDWKDNTVFVATRYSPSLCIFNASSLQPVASPIVLNFTPSSLYYDPVGDRLFVGDMSGDVVHVFDAIHDAFSSTNWPVGGYPTSMAVDPIHNWLYVANSGGSNVSVVNLTSSRPIRTGVPTGPGPGGLTFDSSAQAIIVTPGGFSDSNVTIIPATGNASFLGVWSIPCSFCGGPDAYVPSNGLVLLPQGAPGGFPSTYLAVLDPSATNPVRPDVQVAFSFPAAALDLKNGELYVVDPTGENGSGNPGRYPPYAPGNSSVLALNATTHQFTGKSYAVGFGATAIAYDSANGDLYTANTGGGTVSAIDPVAATVTTISLGPPSEWNLTSPSAVAVDTTTDTIFVADGGTDNVSVIDGTSQTLTSTLHAGSDPDAVLVDATDSRLYVANCGSNNLTLFNTSSGAFEGSLPAGNCPDSLAIAPTTPSLFVANYFGPGGVSNITVVNLTSDQTTASISTGGAADGLAYDAASGFLYVANGYADDVVAINVTSFSAVGSPIATTVGNYETYPTGVVYDSATQEMFVPVAFSSAVYVIANAVTLSGLSASPSPGEAGVPFQLTASPSNGTAPFSFAYSGLPPDCSSGDAPDLWCSTSHAGAYNITAAVTDSRGYRALAETSEEVVPRLAVASLTVKPGLLENGSTLTLATNFSGGLPPFEYQYSGLPTGCPSADLANLSCRPNGAGDFAVEVNVTDSLGVEQSASSEVDIAGPLSASLHFDGANMPVAGSPIALTALVEGGFAPYSYSYAGLPAGCLSVDSPAIVCTPAGPGVYSVLLTVIDARNSSATANLNVSVVPAEPPLPTIVGFVADPSTLNLGESTFLEVFLSTTSPDASFQFTGLPPGCVSENASELSCTPATVGAFTIRVSGSLGAQAFGESQVVVNVVNAPSNATGTPGGSSGSIPLWEGVVVAVSSAIGGVLIGWFLIRRARPPRSPSSATAPSPGSRES